MEPGGKINLLLSEKPSFPCEQLVDDILRPVSSLFAGVCMDYWSAEGAVETSLCLSVLISTTRVCPRDICLLTVKICNRIG